MSTDSETPGLTGADGPATARTIKASEFMSKCLELMDEVAESGEEIIITKNGKPVAKLAPYRERPTTPFGINRGRYEIIGDLDDALNDVEWYAESGRN